MARDYSDLDDKALRAMVSQRMRRLSDEIPD